MTQMFPSDTEKKQMNIIAYVQQQAVLAQFYASKIRARHAERDRILLGEKKS